jgi:predicted transcriptional regulator
MGTLTIRVPDATHERLRRLAEARGVSVNKLIEELSTAALAEFDAETRFRVRAARGSAAEGLRLLDKLEQAYARPAAAQKEAPYRVRRRRT